MRLPIAFALIALLAACNRPPAEAPATSAATTPSELGAAEPEPAFDPNCEFCANPNFVRICEIAQGASTTLYWNVADGNIPQVGIYVVDDAGKDSPFAQQPPQGSIQTGPWLKPGLTFKLKDPAGNVLHSLAIKGKDC